MLTLDADYLKDLFEPFGAVNPRRMFGGIGVFHDGLMFALVADGGLYLKADEGTLPLFEDAGCKPFVYQGKTKPVQLSYWSVPEEALDDPEVMKGWAERAFSAALKAKKT
jgi:DNA transformation protein